MATSNNSTIRFIGYAIPTTPADLKAISDPNGPGAVAGTYLGSDDLNTDIQARIKILKNAVDTAKNQLSGQVNDNSVTNVFIAPGFFFTALRDPMFMVRIQTPAQGGGPNVPGSSDPTFQTLDAADITIVPVATTSDLQSCFAGGSGALHIYGLNTPYTLYP